MLMSIVLLQVVYNGFQFKIMGQVAPKTDRRACQNDFTGFCSSVFNDKMYVVEKVAEFLKRILLLIYSFCIKNLYSTFTFCKAVLSTLPY